MNSSMAISKTGRRLQLYAFVRQLSQLILAMRTTEQPAIARRVALEINALIERLESHAPQDATQEDHV